MTCYSAMAISMAPLLGATEGVDREYGMSAVPLVWQ